MLLYNTAKSAIVASEQTCGELEMHIIRTHLPATLRGSYLFPYRIGNEDKERFWQHTSSSVLSGGLSESAVSNQLFSTNSRLGFVGVMVKHRIHLIKSIQVATLSNVNMDVEIADPTEGLHSDREVARETKWKAFEGILTHAFGLEVR